MSRENVGELKWRKAKNPRALQIGTYYLEIKDGKLEVNLGLTEANRFQQFRLVPRKKQIESGEEDYVFSCFPSEDGFVEKGNRAGDKEKLMEYVGLIEGAPGIPAKTRQELGVLIDYLEEKLE